MNELKNWLDELLSKSNIATEWINLLSALILIAAVMILAWVGFQLIKISIVKLIYPVIRRTQSQWDDAFIKHKTFRKIAHLFPPTLFKYTFPLILVNYPITSSLLDRLIDVYLIVVLIKIIISFLNSFEEYLSNSETFREKPLASYFQLARIILYIAGFILILSTILGKSPLYFLGAFGAMTAILLLVFKDTILGLVASVQISSNDMFRVGDWVEMPKYNADGDVIAINLNTVKIRNWDKTITTIPTHYFITDSFKNWRGMQESGGRRIKRSIYINISSIQFVSPEWRDELKKIHLVKNYLTERQAEIEKFNTENNIDTSILINGRRLTNIGIFRVYAEAYLKNHPSIHKGMTLMVRQLASTEFGLPIEIYCFTNTIKWTEYESIQSDIFDHLLSAAEYFKLQIFQSPSGHDFNGSFSGNNPVA